MCIYFCISVYRYIRSHSEGSLARAWWGPDLWTWQRSHLDGGARILRAAVWRARCVVGISHEGTEIALWKLLWITSKFPKYEIAMRLVGNLGGTVWKTYFFRYCALQTPKSTQDISVRHGKHCPFSNCPLAPYGPLPVSSSGTWQYSISRVAKIDGVCTMA